MLQFQCFTKEIFVNNIQANLVYYKNITVNYVRSFEFVMTRN